MVGFERMAAIARRYDTVVARAFRVALGIPAAYARPARPPEARPGGDPDLLECFANRRGVLDALH